MKKISNIFDYNLTINNNSQSDNIALFPEDILNPKLIKSKNADKLDLLIKDQNSKSITKKNSTLDQFIQKDFEINIKNNQNQTTIKTYIQSIEPEQNVLPYHTIGIYNDFANNILSSISPRKKQYPEIKAITFDTVEQRNNYARKLDLDTIYLKTLNSSGYLFTGNK